MEKYQAIEAVYVLRGVLAQEGMNFFTILSAYLVVAYLVAAKLTTFQIWTVSILYSVFCAGPILGFYLCVLDLAELDYGARVPQIENPYLVPSVMVLGWAMSIMFMVSVRRKKPEVTV